MSEDRVKNRQSPEVMSLQTFTRLDALFTAIGLVAVFLFYVGTSLAPSRVQEEAVKTNITKIAVSGALVVLLVAGVAFAQGGGPERMHHRMMRHPGMGGPAFGMMLHRLNLTDAQKAQVKQIFETERPNIKPLMQQQFQSHQQMMQLITGGNFDQAKATAIATQEAQTRIQMEVEHAKIASQIYQLLDSTQKAKVADMMARHQQMMQNHFQHQGQGPSAPPEQ
jgi:periplasmic protein CpxP/Spy